MRVKRYVVDSMPDALQKIRNELGKDAVILNTKEIRSGGFLGFFGKKKIEVIAATDQSAPMRHQPMKPPATAKATANNESVVLPAQAKVSQPVPISPQAAAYVAVMEPVKSAVQHNQPVKEDLLLEELKQMKEMVSKLSFISQDNVNYPQPLSRLKQRLLDQEIDPVICHEIIQNAINEAPIDNQWTLEKADQLVRGQLKKKLGTDHCRSLSAETRIAHFVGPTGVGKTTTIAKLAAEQVLKYNRKVGFITSDTYRIAAVEQLKTYANILNIPLEVVFSPQELVKAFQQMQDCDIIFMDTAGRNFRNQMYVSELNSLLKSRGLSETFLVLSLTAKYKDMKAITENFAKFHLDKVLFTKMDETRSYGAIINLLHDFPIKLSYMTNGQNVPDDIIEVNDDKILDLILEEKTDE